MSIFVAPKGPPNLGVRGARELSQWSDLDLPFAWPIIVSSNGWILSTLYETRSWIGSQLRVYEKKNGRVTYHRAAPSIAQNKAVALESVSPLRPSFYAPYVLGSVGSVFYGANSGR